MTTPTSVYTLTNGFQNFIFEVGSRHATIKTINAFGYLAHEEERTLAQARYQWKMALKHGCVKGWTQPTVTPLLDSEELLCAD